MVSVVLPICVVPAVEDGVSVVVVVTVKYGRDIVDARVDPVIVGNVLVLAVNELGVSA